MWRWWHTKCCWCRNSDAHGLLNRFAWNNANLFDYLWIFKCLLVGDIAPGIANERNKMYFLCAQFPAQGFHVSKHLFLPISIVGWFLHEKHFCFVSTWNILIQRAPWFARARSPHTHTHTSTVVLFGPIDSFLPCWLCKSTPSFFVTWPLGRQISMPYYFIYIFVDGWIRTEEL